VLFALTAVALALDVHDAIKLRAAAVTVGLPPVAVLALVLTYATRGSSFRMGANLLVAVPAAVLALIPVLGAGAPAYVLPVAVLALLVFVVAAADGSSRRRENAPGAVAWAWAYRALVAVTWLALGLVVLFDVGEAWMRETLLVVAIVAALCGLGVPRLAPGRRRARPRTDLIGPEASGAVALSLVGMALAGLGALDAGWARAVAGATCGVLMLGASAAVLVLGGWLRLFNPRTAWRFARVRVTSEDAATALGGTDDGPGPYVATRILKLGAKVSEIADTNDAPFYKSFLRLDVEDGDLVIRCYGVTGYQAVEETPTLEDCLRIALTPPAASATQGD
jgi:hypothetical protein